MTCILIVEDSDTQREAIVRYIKSAELVSELLTTETTAKTLDLLSRTGSVPDIALIDQFLPDGTGTDLIKALKAQGDGTYFILMTAKGSEEVSRAAILENVDDFITKTDEHALNAAISFAFDRYRKYREKCELEERLRDSEERYRLLIENAPQGFISVDLTGQIKKINPKILDILGSPSTEATLAINVLAFPPMVAAGIADDIRKCLETGTTAVCERPYVSKWQKHIYLRYHLAAIRDQTGTICGCQALVEDITARKQTERLIETQRDMGLALSVVTTLQDGLRICLDAALAVSGMDCGGIYLLDTGTGALDLAYHSGLPGPFVADASHFGPTAHQTQLVRTGEAIYTSYAGIDYPKNEIRSCEGLQAFATIPITHENTVIGCLNIASHVIDSVPMEVRASIEIIAAHIGNSIVRIQAEESVREGQKNLQALFDNLEDLIFVMSMTGTILAVNPIVETRLGYTTGELVGRSVVAVHPPDRRDEARGVITAMLAGTESVCRVPIQAKNGALIPVETKVTRGTWNNEKVLFGISRDMSERLEAEEARQRLIMMIETSKEFFALATLDGKVTYMNKAGLDLIGLHRLEDAIPRTIKDFLTAEGLHEYTTSILPEVLERGWKSGEILLRQMRTGELIDVAYQHFLIYTPGTHTPTHLATVLRDIRSEKAAERALRDSEAKYRLVSEHIPVAVYSALPDEHSTNLFISGRMKELTGYEVDAFMSDPDLWGRLIHPDDRDTVWTAIDEHRARKRPLNIEYRIITHDGAVKWIRDSATPMLDERGAIVRIDGFMEDITGRKLAESAMCESEERFRSLVEQSEDGIAVMDEFGIIIEWNHAMETLTGIPKTTAVGLEVWDVQEQAAVRPAPYLSMIRTKLQDFFHETELQNWQDNEWFHRILEYPMRHRDGTIRTVQARTFPIQTHSRGRLGMIMRDISDLKRTMRALEVSEATLQSIFRAAPIGIGVTHTRVIGWTNPMFQKMVGYSEEELRGQSARLVYPNDAEFDLVGHDNYNQMVHNGIGTIETKWQRKDGTVIDVLLSSTPIDAAEPEAGIIFTALDITARKRTEAQLKGSLREKEVLLREIHHRVKNNLQVISSMLTLQAGCIKDEVARELFHESTNRVRTMGLIHEKLYTTTDLSQIEFADYIRSLTVHLFSAYGVRSDAVVPEYDLEEHALEITMAIPCGLIINELVSNCLKHAFPEIQGSGAEPHRADKNTIRIVFKRVPTGQFLLIVKDNGCGLPQGIDIQTAETLGLQLISILTNQLGGTIELTSDHGTQFKILFGPPSPAK